MNERFHQVDVAMEMIYPSNEQKDMSSRIRISKHFSY
jgi:hypothetical protein